MTATDHRPAISVVMANYNGAAHIAAAVRSVLTQTASDLELVLSDDGSGDDSVQRALAEAAGDERMKIVRGPAQTGPAAARNRALAVARGAWIAIVDNDDLIEPDRLSRLVSAAEQDGADIAADDLLTFYEDSARTPHRHLKLDAPRWVSAADYAASNILMRGGAQLGYLKPIFKRALLGANAYDETLRIGEDSDLVLRLLIGGAKMRIYPEAGYHYRKHAGSISHRLSAATLDAMLAAHERLRAGDDAPLHRALARQRAALLDARAFADMVASLKQRNLAGVTDAVRRRPGALLLLRDPILDRTRKFIHAG